MLSIRHDHYFHADPGSQQQLDRIESQLAKLITQGAVMARALQQNMQDLRVIGQQYLDLIKAKDAANADLQAKIADLVAQVAAGTLQITELQAEIDSAVADSQATEDALRAGLPGVPPVGGVPLNLSYADRATFSAAVAAYTGPESVTLDGANVKSGGIPTLDYFTHSATGELNTTGPTD